MRQALVSRAWLRVPDVWVPRVERKKGERALPVHMILLVTNDNVYHTHCSVHYPRTRQASSSNQSRSLSVSVSAARESSDLRKQKTRAEQPLRCLEQAPQVLAKRPVVAASPPAKFSRVFYSADGDFCCVEMIDPEAQAVLRGQNLPHLEKRRRALDCEDAGPFQGHARWQQCLLSLSLQILEKRFPGGVEMYGVCRLCVVKAMSGTSGNCCAVVDFPRKTHGSVRAEFYFFHTASCEQSTDLRPLRTSTFRNVPRPSHSSWHPKAQKECHQHLLLFVLSDAQPMRQQEDCNAVEHSR